MMGLRALKQNRQGCLLPLSMPHEDTTRFENLDLSTFENYQHIDCT